MVLIHIRLFESRNTPINGLSYSPAQVFGNRRTKTRLPTTTQLLDATIPTAYCLTESTEAVFWQRSQVTTSCQNCWWHCSTKRKNGWKSDTGTKLNYTPWSVIVTSSGTDVNKGTITSPTSNRGIAKRPGSDIIETPGVIRTRRGRSVRPPSLDEFVNYLV